MNPAELPLARLYHTDYNYLLQGSAVEYVKDIEINDLKNRYMLTKGATQQKIKQDTGAE